MRPPINQQVLDKHGTCCARSCGFISLTQLYSPFSAIDSTECEELPMDSVKKVPTFRPPTMVLIAFSCIPLQITTLTPRSMAQVAALTFESMPPVPTCEEFGRKGMDDVNRFQIKFQASSRPRPAIWRAHSHNRGTYTAAPARIEVSKHEIARL